MDGSRYQASGLHQRSFSEFLTPSRRSHPHMEPLLAPYKFLTSKQGAKMFLSLQGMHFLSKYIILEVSYSFYFDKIPSADSLYKVSLIAKLCSKSLHLPLVPCRMPHFSLLFPQSNFPQNPPYNPSHIPCLAHFLLIPSIVTQFCPQITSKRAKLPYFSYI